MSGEVRYQYDSLNRLIAVTDETGATAVYHYDAVGNLLAISRHGPAEVVILDFSPRSGLPGTAVTIKGVNFSPNLAQNQVQFNGVDATVQTATTTQLTVVVPASATTGPIRVTTPQGAGTTVQPFVVLPEVSAVNPSFGQQGATVDLEISGRRLVGASGLKFDSPDGISVVGDLAVNAQGTVLSARITISAGAPIGERQVTVITPDGISVPSGSNADKFIVLSNEAITQASAGVRVLVQSPPRADTGQVRVLVESPSLIYAPPVKVEQSP